MIYLLITSLILGIIIAYIGLTKQIGLVYTGGICVWLISFISLCLLASKDSKITTYKVKELEKNTVFYITDSIGHLNVSDSIWVNMKTKQVDVVDTNTMMCVVLEKIK